LFYFFADIAIKIIIKIVIKIVIKIIIKIAIKITIKIITKITIKIIANIVIFIEIVEVDIRIVDIRDWIGFQVEADGAIDVVFFVYLNLLVVVWEEASFWIEVFDFGCVVVIDEFDFFVEFFQI